MTQPVATHRVALLMGSQSDLEAVRPAIDVLRELHVECTVRVLSAHRTPERTAEFARSAAANGYATIICAAGAAAHLAGAVAAQTTLPVIGLPLARTPLGGQDALLATVQMPSGMPVATVAIDGAYNAGLLAAQILATANRELADRVAKLRVAMVERVIKADAEVVAATQS